VGTRKISQLDTIADANLSGEAILPVVVSDPLIPNRKVKVNQLFKGISQGEKATPGLCFDLDRDTGLYQDAYDQLGLGFGDGGLYLSRIENSATSSSLYITAVDEETDNADIVLSPKGTGAIKVTGNFVVSDQTFILEDAQGPRVRFEAGLVGTGNTIRIMTFPAITAGSGTTLVGDDTTQTLRNKTILIDEDNFVITDGDEEAIFQINWAITSDTRRSYFLPDAGAVTTTAEPTATASTLLDTKAVQTALNKTLVDPKFATDSEAGTAWAQINTDALTANRTITVPDLSLTLVGTDTTQTLTNKTVKTLILADATDATKRITFDTENQNTASNRVFEFPPTGDLNTTVDDNNTILTELATQEASNKTAVQLKISDAVTPYDEETETFGDTPNYITFRTDNLTANRTIRFPDGDATLLSTTNTTLDDVTFGAGIGGETLTGRTRQQQFFYAGF
jgi:uncharacterized protein YxjI